MQEQNTNPLEGGTYEIIQTRLQKHKADLLKRLEELNLARKAVFGATETKLVANDRINTENTCTARDIVALGNTCLFGYNVHFGLRTEIQLSDVFSIYDFKDGRFQEQPIAFIEDGQFESDFQNLYKYYRKTFFTKFSIKGNYLYMVFQVSDKVEDIKTFKWLIKDNRLSYIDNRSEHEYAYPKQHEFNWQESNFEMHRNGLHPHVSILDKVFVETVGGDLTIKIEDNTNDGKGIYREPVEYADQTLEDGKFTYADLGNLTVLGIKPYQETTRYFVYNHKVQEVERIQSIADAAVLLPDNHGLIFPDGYYLQTGEFKKFEKSIAHVKFQEKIAAPNGEDFMYVFYSEAQGEYVLMNYNLIEQTVQTPILCNGFTLLENGELVYFRGESEATKHHVIQIWQTPFSKQVNVSATHSDSLLFKIGNKDVVRAMAECQEIVTLLNKEDSYDGLYVDIAKRAGDILDSYYWISEKETMELNVPLEALKLSADSAIGEFEKVVQLKKNAEQATSDVEAKVTALFDKIKHSSFKSIEDFVLVLNGLRSAQGAAISLKDVRYTDAATIDALTAQITEQSAHISRRCITFLLDEKALAPFHNTLAIRKKELESVKKVIAARELEVSINQTASDLEMLIEIVNNLQIEDTSHSTKIIEHISVLFSEINQQKAALKRKVQTLSASESQADFLAQLHLFDQSIINFIDIANTPEKCDEFLTKLSVQLEELEGKFADFDDYVLQINEKREEVYSAFETRKSALVEAKNKKAIALQNAADRILKSIAKKAETLSDNEAINGYFASDLMVSKTQSLVEQLKELEESGKAESIESNLKSIKEETVRKLKDKQELYEDGENVIRLGKHKFGVNKQPLDLNIVVKDKVLYYHLSGTDFYEKVSDETLRQSEHIWNQELVSENEQVYRSEYLAFKIYRAHKLDELTSLDEKSLLALVQKIGSENYAEGYTKGVHDLDAFTILSYLVKTESNLGLLRFSPQIRANAQLFWSNISAEEQQELNAKIKAAGQVLHLFPAGDAYQNVIAHLENKLTDFVSIWTIDPALIKESAAYLFYELNDNDGFCISQNALDAKNEFLTFLKKKNSLGHFTNSLATIEGKKDKVDLARQWVSAFLQSTNQDSFYTDEIVVLLLSEKELAKEINHFPAVAQISTLKGSHPLISKNEYTFDYHRFIDRLTHYSDGIAREFVAFKSKKKEFLIAKKEALKLDEFKPKVLSSFVRNRLIDQVYLPLFGDNLAKQLGTVGDGKRTDRMGMLLLISPPGYGKTTLMEYVSERLGLVFVKINGPAIGHEITSVDPESANNAAARQELEKLNLALEMGNNVMLYIDDIQHCNTAFLQKFISLADGQRKIEGIYNGNSKTYDFRDKKFCVIMAGNPYTESGDKFQIPDMLANRADIYNLGDVIGSSVELFELSLIENSLTSNDLLRQLASKNNQDVMKIIQHVVTGGEHTLTLEGNHSKLEIQDYVSVMEKVVKIRNTVLKANAQYIKSAATDDAYRTEPPFKLQGSYRDMNKLAAKVVPIMNNQELDDLLMSHYESEAQTLTSSAEANLLKYKELIGKLSIVEQKRWEMIKTTFVKNNKLKGFGNANEMAQVLNQLMQFSENLEGIKAVLSQGFGNQSTKE